MIASSKLSMSFIGPDGELPNDAIGTTLENNSLKNADSVAATTPARNSVSKTCAADGEN